MAKILKCQILTNRFGIHLYTFKACVFCTFAFLKMIRVGKIVATHGLQGAAIMTHTVGAQWLSKDDTLFVEMQKGSFIPYFVTEAKAHKKDEYIIGFEDVATVEAARRLIGKHVYTHAEVLAKYAKDSPLLWIGFTLIDKEKGALGPIEDMMQTPSQWLAKCTYQGKEVLVPLVEQTINKVDIKVKQLHITLPEGLLEVYLGA